MSYPPPDYDPRRVPTPIFVTFIILALSVIVTNLGFTPAGLALVVLAMLVLGYTVICGR